jgi:pimeloyl-ACP methyl ester carboxylesterase
MTPQEFHQARQVIATRFGDIATVAAGEGAAALFIHGLPLNGYHWRYALAQLSGLRRCIAPDLMGLGYTEAADGQDLSFDSQAAMLLALLDEMGLETVDLVANDSGVGIAQILAAQAPSRVRSLVLTNGDVHDNWPPPAVHDTHALAEAGMLGTAIAQILSEPETAATSPLAAPFQFPERLTPELLEVYLAPIAANPRRRSQIDRYVTSMDCAQTLRIHDSLRALKAPALIVWGDNDIFFPTVWAYWLRDTLPGARQVAILNEAKLFLAEERPDEFCALVADFWRGLDSGRTASA